MKIKLRFWMVLFSLLSIGISDIHAQTVAKPRPGRAGTWRYLGTVKAASNVDHDVIYVTGQNDYFRRIKFKVTNSPIEIFKIIVRYDGGAPENIEVRNKIPKGGESRIIDLRGGRRKLRSVEFWYRDKGFMDGKADLSLFGMK